MATDEQDTAVGLVGLRAWETNRRVTLGREETSDVLQYPERIDDDADVTTPHPTLPEEHASVAR